MTETLFPLKCVKKVIGLACTQSTQTLAKELALCQEPSGTLVLADRQTGGRGRYDRTFSAQEGGIYFTLILRPHKTAEYNASLSVKVGQAVAAALEQTGVKTKVKLPNDVLVWQPRSKKWKKICGILIETSAQEDGQDWMLVGVGVNVNNDLPPSLQPIAASLRSVLRAPVSREWLLDEILAQFWRRYAEWEASSKK